ncbi:MAG: enoyl-CoA hydratase/isomerase family protein [Vulcanimicrobiaceae bacterium]
MSERIIVGREGRLGRITLAAGRLNILGTSDVRALEEAVRSLGESPVVLLDAEGTSAFSAGMDIADHTRDRAPEMLAAFGKMIAAFDETSSVIVAKVGAPALGGGFEVVLLCDLAICSERAIFSLPEIKLAALAPVACGVLPALIGRARANDLILTGRRVDAQTALQWGIVTRLAAPDALDQPQMNSAKSYCRSRRMHCGVASELCGPGLSLNRCASIPTCCSQLTMPRRASMHSKEAGLRSGPGRNTARRLSYD